MAQVIADRRDIDFVLHEQLEVGEFSKHEKFAEFNKKVVDMVITEARNLAIKEVLPTLKIGDEEGCKFENGKVTTPEAFKRAQNLMIEGEWLAPSRDPKWGGQGMPETLAMGAKEYLIGANMALLIIGGLTHGAARLVEVFGTDRQKELFLKKMYTGQWMGTMLLTEPEAGSDLGALTTSAVKNDNGTYSITGNKIFITGGEHDLSENIIHPVLARIEGAPEGSRGISLFLVPKFQVNEDGSLGEPNDVVCTGIEEKMGIHGSPTCSMSLGSKGNCIGELLGEENKGLAAMFVMMNEERLMVGAQAVACTSSAYLHALEFARTRIQGAMLGVKDGESVAIINHPDIRRMLLTMKMYTEGMRSLLYYISYCEDKKELVQTEEEREKYQGLIDVLIPVGKGYVTDRAVEMCNMGIQVFGGYGYTSEYPMEQLFRDVRITPIYEGTNGIQAMDLLGRKLGMKKGKLFITLIGEMQKTLETAKGMEKISFLVEKFAAAIQKLGDTAMHIGMTAMGKDLHKAFSFATTFLDVTGDVTMAWMLLWRATIACQKLEEKPKKKDVAYYEGLIKSAEYFSQTVLPVAYGKMAAIKEMGGAAIEIEDEAFGGK